METNKTKKLYEDIKKNKELFNQIFHENSDITLREFKLSDGTDGLLIFMQGVCDQDAQRQILYSIFNSKIPRNKPIINFLTDNVITQFGCKKLSDPDEMISFILEGDTILLIDGETSAINIATAQWVFRSISEPPTSTILSGPREGFTEDLKVNLTLIRRRMHTPDLIIERLKIGRYTNTDVAIIYVDGIADKYIVKKITGRLKKIDIDGILDIFYIQQFLEENPGSMFKQSGSAEKPDIVCGKILEGRIAIMVNGSPMAITVPYIMYEDFQQSEDYYTKNSKTTFLRAIRMIAVLVGILLPGYYASIQIYHYTVIPQEFLFTLMSAIQGLPTKPLMEMMIVLLLFEIIHEASFRMPRYVGMAMSIVGALVLGDTAVKAGILSSPSIMIMALSSISLYTVPDQVGTFRLLRIAFTLIAGFSGLFGIISFLTMLIIYLSSLDSYGTAYLAPFAPLIRQDLKDSVYQRTLVHNDKRPMSIPNINITRMNVNDD